MKWKIGLSVMAAASLAPMACALAVQPSSSPAVTSAASVSPNAELLIQKANYWQTHGRSDLAAEEWSTVLKMYPDNERALTYMALYSLDKGDRTDANRYKRRLASAHPQSPSVALIDSAMSGAPQTLSRLRTAQNLLESGHKRRALAEFGDVFGSGVPPMPYANEYYGLMSRTPAGRKKAVSALAKFVAAHPNNDVYRLLWARLMARDENTRKQAFSQFEKLAKRPGIRLVSRPYWRQAIAWGEKNPANLEAIKRYLVDYPQSRFPDPSLVAIAKRLGKREASGSGQSPAVAEGFRELHAGHAGRAAAAFEKRLARKPGDREASVGLASAYMRLGRYEKAKRALRHAGTAPGADRLRREAAFWAAIARAKAAQADGRHAQARGALDAASSRANGSPAELMALAGMRRRLGQYALAEKDYRRVLSAHPGSAPAWIGLLDTARASGNRVRAAEIEQGMPLSVKRSLRSDPSHVARMASAMSKRGNPLEAANLLSAFADKHPAKATPSLNLQKAWYLYDAGADSRLYATLRTLREQKLSEAQSRQAENLYLYAARREAVKAISNGEPNVAVDIMGRAAKLYPNSARAKLALADAWLRGGYPGKAYAVAKAAGPGGTAQGYRIAIGSAIGAGQWRQAESWASEAVSKWPSDPALRELYAKAAAGAGERKLARSQWRKAYAMTDTKAASGDGGTGYAFLGKGKKVPGSGSTGHDAYGRREIAAIHASASKALKRWEKHNAAQVSGFVDFHNRSGSRGFDAMRMTRMGASYSQPLGSGRLRVSASSVTVGNDSASGKGKAIWAFGTEAVTHKSAQSRDTIASTSQSGVSARLAFGTKRWGVSLGHTPTNFHASHFVGKVWFKPLSAPIKITLSRTAVKQSELSYAGLKDRLTGKVWGGAVDNAARLSFGTAVGHGAKVHGSVAAGVITGDNIRKNTHLSAEGGIVWTRKGFGKGQKFSYGLDANVMAFANNDSHYTFGSGGYFSPQSFFSLGVPLSLSGKIGSRGKYSIGATIGYHQYSYSSAAYFPTRPGLEAASGGKVFSSGTASGLFYGVHASLDYRIDHNLSAGLDLSLSDSKGYHDQKVMARLRYRFGK